MVESPVPGAAPEPVEGSAGPGSQPAVPATPPPPATPLPTDGRAKPRFGELAPPGWEWKPPTDAAEHVAPVPPSPAAAPAAAPAPASVAPVAPAAGPQTRPAPAWDRPITIGLIVLGLLGLITTIQLQNTVTQAIAMLHEQEGLEAYSPAESVATILLWGTIIQVAVWFLTAAGSLALILRHRLAFWVPIVGGVVSAIVVFGVIFAVLLTDPALLDSVAQRGA